MEGNKSSVFKAGVSSLPWYWQHPLQKGRIIKKSAERIVGRHKTFIIFTTFIILQHCKQLVYFNKLINWKTGKLTDNKYLLTYFPVCLVQVIPFILQRVFPNQEKQNHLYKFTSSRLDYNYCSSQQGIKSPSYRKPTFIHSAAQVTVNMVLSCFALILLHIKINSRPLSRHSKPLATSSNFSNHT